MAGEPGPGRNDEQRLADSLERRRHRPDRGLRHLRAVPLRLLPRPAPRPGRGGRAPQRRHRGPRARGPAHRAGPAARLALRDRPQGVHAAPRQPEPAHRAGGAGGRRRPDLRAARPPRGAGCSRTARSPRSAAGSARRSTCRSGTSWTRSTCAASSGSPRRDARAGREGPRTSPRAARRPHRAEPLEELPERGGADRVVAADPADVGVARPACGELPGVRGAGDGGRCRRTGCCPCCRSRRSPPSCGWTC